LRVSCDLTRCPGIVIADEVFNCISEGDASAFYDVTGGGRWQEVLVSADSTHNNSQSMPERFSYGHTERLALCRQDKDVSRTKLPAQRIRVDMAEELDATSNAEPLGALLGRDKFMSDSRPTQRSIHSAPMQFGNRVDGHERPLPRNEVAHRKEPKRAGSHHWA
jgi:hypothetical protein